MRMGVGWEEKLAESSISVTTQPPFCQLCLHHNATTVHCNGLKENLAKNNLPPFCQVCNNIVLQCASALALLGAR